VAASDVLIDFTRPAGTLAHVAACRAAGRGVVVGTTGFEPDQLAALRDAARETAIVLAPNFSIGVNVALKLVDLAARALGPAYDVEVFEMHHKLKVDAPSGTALKLGEVAAAARETSLERDGVFARHGVTGERKAGTIGFSVARGGDIIGDHTVYFAGTGERIEITHRSQSRATYAQGAIRAAKWLRGRAPGLYGMEDVLSLR
jgi:4-hydroxy-tetrahydrodipicolinate reductase